MHGAADCGKASVTPDFLQKGLEGDRSQCQRVTALAVKDGLIEVGFLSLLARGSR